MVREEVIQTFNRGIVSPLILGRVDIDRIRVSAEVQTNWVSREVGSMMLRPGTQYLGSSKDDAEAKYIPFVFSIEDKALIEITDQFMRVWVDDQVIERPSVTAVVANGDFTTGTGLDSWDIEDETGAQSFGFGTITLRGSGNSFARIRQQVSINEPNIRHALAVEIDNGPITIKVGSAEGGSEYFEHELGQGFHSLAFTPTGPVHIELSNSTAREARVTSCQIESGGDMVIPCPWRTEDLRNIRHDASADITYVACDGHPPYEIQRRSTDSWSVVRYLPEDGPFRLTNTSNITIRTTGGLNSSTALVASMPLFRQEHVGALFRITSNGQRVGEDLTGENQFTSTVRVTGVGESRRLNFSGANIFSATWTLQRSFTSETGPFEDVQSQSNGAGFTIVDGFDNQIVWYRIGIKEGDYTSGIVTARLDTPLGVVDGYVRIRAVNTDQVNAFADVISPVPGQVPTTDWAEGQWSDLRGYPTSVAFAEGRLCWAGRNGLWMSVSDNFLSFDETIEGDSAPISRVIGFGPVDRINWLVSLQRLLIGTDLAELSVKSSSFDEPLTQTDSTIKYSATHGSANVAAVRVDDRAIYVQRGGIRLRELSFSGGNGFEYASSDLTSFNPTIMEPGVNHVAVQRQRDTRVHCIRTNGKPAVLVFNPFEELVCWFDVETDGEVEDVTVLPGDSGDNEDIVYYHVKRTINGVTKRYLERWSFEEQCQGDAISRQMDSHTIYDGVETLTISGLDHLEGKDVVVWGNGKDLGSHPVSSGQIILPEAVTQACIGLPYVARWRSTKLSLFSTQKRVSHLGVLLNNTHSQGLRYGSSFDKLDPLPKTVNGRRIEDNELFADYDEQRFEFPGNWDSDSRICLEAASPRPCTILAMNYTLEQHSRN